MATTEPLTDRLDWNGARSLASQLIQTDEEWTDVLEESQLQLSQRDVEEAKSTLPEDGTDRVNELARTLLEWQNKQRPPVDINDTPASIDGWNDARSVASAMKTIVTSDAGAVFDDLRDHLTEPAPTFEEAHEEWEEIGTHDGGEALNEYARWVLNWDASDESETTDTTSGDNPYDSFTPTTRAEACANELLRIFETHQGGYGDILSEYRGDFDLPSLGRTNVVVVNAKGDTHDERVEDIVHWLIHELDDEKSRAGAYR